MSIHVIGVFLFKKNKLLNNVLSKLYSYFIDKELQHSDDSIVCLADVISCLSRKSWFMIENYQFVTLLTILKLIAL